jgi:hypothetical protein
MLLIARGAYIEQKDKHGRTVVDWMKQLGGRDELAAEVKDIAALRKAHRQLLIDISCDRYETVKETVRPGEVWEPDKSGILTSRLHTMQRDAAEQRSQLLLISQVR